MSEILHLQLETAHRLDRVFDKHRFDSLEEATPVALAALDSLLPGHQWFLMVDVPEAAPSDELGVLATRRVTISTGPEAAAAAERIARPPGPGLATGAGALYVGLFLEGRYLGALGATPIEAGDDALEALMLEASRRFDTEVELQLERIRQKLLARLCNHALEDYFLERGLESAIRVLIRNGVCTDAILVYDQSGVDGQWDIISEFFTEHGKLPLKIPQAEVLAFLADENAWPAVIRQRLAAGQWLTLPLCKREAGGARKVFGRITFLSSHFSYTSRLLLEEVTEDLDSAMINYHEKRRELGRFLCPPVVRSLLDGDRREIEARLSPRRREMALGFADIVGYSKMCSQYSKLPHQIAALLRDWKQQMREVTFRHGGIVDKFIGDCLFYHRGPVSDDPPPILALDALRIAVACAQATASYDGQLQDYGFSAEDRLRVSIGLHIGSDLVVGDIGGEFTAIGADVNLAQRIQASEFTSGKIVVSERFAEYTRARLPDVGPYQYGPRTELKLKGVGAFAVYELVAAP